MHSLLSLLPVASDFSPSAIHHVSCPGATACRISVWRAMVVATPWSEAGRALASFCTRYILP